MPDDWREEGQGEKGAEEEGPPAVAVSAQHQPVASFFFLFFLNK